MNIENALKIVFTDVERAAEIELKELGKKELPIVINRLKVAQTQQGGIFKFIRNDVEEALEDLFEDVLDWCNTPTPPATA